MRSPVVLGINRTSDASVCLMEGDRVIVAIQKERLTRVKHAWGKRGDVSELYRAYVGSDRPIDLVVECYASDPEIEHLEQYHKEIVSSLRFSGYPRIIQIPHHRAHAYSAFLPSSFANAAAMVIDYQGSPLHLCGDDTDQGGPADAVEVASFYTCAGGTIRCFEKDVWDKSRHGVAGLGAFYSRLSRTLFNLSGHEGTVMGLAPFGQADACHLPDLVVDGGKVRIPAEWQSLFDDPAGYRFFVDGSGDFHTCANLAARGQQAFESALLSVARWLRVKTGASDLVYAGGCALNCAANATLARAAGFNRVFIPPAPHDGGTAVGCALYGQHALGYDCRFRWSTDCLGPTHDFDEGLREADLSGLVVDTPLDLVREIAARLVHGNVVALYQQRSELGPRALGHRSIVADPRLEVTRSFINDRVKGRHWFRPLAPAVLQEHTARYFDLSRPSPFMQYAVDVLPSVRRCLAAVTHIDGTARVQTVSRDGSPLLYDLVEAFGNATGTYVLLNTSFNGKNQPIVETPSQAIECFRNTPIHALAMPPYLIGKANCDQHPFRS